MNVRDNFRIIMDGGSPAELPVIAFEGYESDTLARWRAEGMPADKSLPDALHADGIEWLPLGFGPMPPFEQKIVQDGEEDFLKYDWMGALVRHMKVSPQMYYGYVDHPVKNRADWKDYSRRFSAITPGRANMDPALACQALEKSQKPVVLNMFPFFFRLGFYSLGMERFMTAFYDEPELIHEMFDHWTDFVLGTIRPFLGTVKIDMAVFTEDFAYKNGTHLSPDIYREFFLPRQSMIVEELKRAGIKTIAVWSAGNFDCYIPMLLESGINTIMILERMSGMDPIQLRKRYGAGMRMIGGVSKEALIAGPKALDVELDRLAPLVREGGYLPAIDDMIPPEVPLSHYTHYIEKSRSLKY